MSLLPLINYGRWPQKHGSFFRAIDHTASRYKHERKRGVSVKIDEHQRAEWTLSAVRDENVRRHHLVVPGIVWPLRVAINNTCWLQHYPTSLHKSRDDYQVSGAQYLGSRY